MPISYSTERYPIVSYVFNLVKSLVANFTTLLSLLWPYAAATIAFVAFVVWNGSVVVGDQSHHQASLHVPQVFYFATFTCFFASGQLVLNWRLALGFVKMFRQPRWLLVFLFLVAVGCIAVKHFT